MMQWYIILQAAQVEAQVTIHSIAYSDLRS